MSYPPAKHMLSRDTTIEIAPEHNKSQILRNMKPTHENAPPIPKAYLGKATDTLELRNPNYEAKNTGGNLITRLSVRYQKGQISNSRSNIK